MLYAAILTLLKAGGGQQLGRFGAHVLPASPPPSEAKEKIVHVKEHTRQTHHGVQVVAAHDVRRHMFGTLADITPEDRARAAADHEQRKQEIARRVSRDDVLDKLPKLGEKGPHIDRLGFTGINHVIGAVMRHHKLGPADYHAVREHVDQVLTQAHRDDKILREHRPGNWDLVAHNRGGSRAQA